MRALALLSFLLSAGCMTYREEFRRSWADAEASNADAGLEPQGPPPPAFSEPADTCCVRCKNSQPCGSSCIPWGHRCHVVGGCAC